MLNKIRLKKYKYNRNTTIQQHTKKKQSWDKNKQLSKNIKKQHTDLNTRHTIGNNQLYYLFK